MKNFKQHPKRGQTLIFALIFMGIILIFSSTIFTKVGNYITFNANSLYRDQAKHIAEAGLDATIRAFANSSSQSSYSGENLTNVGTTGQFSSTVTHDANNLISISATGFVPNSAGFKAKQVASVQAVPSNSNTQDIMSNNAVGAAVKVNDYIYMIGGDWQCNGNNVQFAHIKPDYTLDTWNTTASVPVKTQGPAIVVNGYIYVVGDCNDQGKVYFAKPNANGTISSWTQTTPLPIEPDPAHPQPDTVRRGYSLATANSYIYVVGGVSGACPDGNNPCAAHNDVRYGYADPIAGTVSTWQLSPNKISNDSWGAWSDNSSVVANDTLFVIQGHLANSAENKIKRASVFLDGSLGTFAYNVSSVDLPGHITNSAIVVANNYVYLVGGVLSTINEAGNYSAEGSDKVYFAPIIGNNIGDFSTSLHRLPVPHAAGGAVTFNNKIYYLGGIEIVPYGNDHGNTWSANIQANHDIDDWTDNNNAITYSGWAVDTATYQLK